MARIALYSHDTLGLGHLRRCLKLAHHLREHFGSVDGMLLTGSPWHGLFPPPAGFRIVPLAPVVKTAGGDYRSRDIELGLEAVLDRRRRVVTEEIEAFAPQLFVVDNVPCGLRGEVVDALLRVRAGGGRNVLALRDVLDDLETIREEWRRAGAIEAVAELFDEIWLFGDATDAAELTGGGPLSHVASRVRACGRIGQCEVDVDGGLEPPAGRPVVLVTGGGGRDASPLMLAYLEAVHTYRPPVTSHLVLGPDFPALHEPTASPLPDLEIESFVHDLPRRLARSSVIVSMAGYNTVCEILASGRPAVLVPRVTPRQEQLLRARRWQREGRARMIEPSRLTPEGLWTAVEELLASPGHRRLPASGGRAAAVRAEALLASAGGG